MERAIIMSILTAAMIAVGGALITSSAAFSERAEHAADAASAEYAACRIASAVAKAVAEAKVQGTPTSVLVLFSGAVGIDASGSDITATVVANGKEADASLKLAIQINISPVRRMSSAFNITGFPDGTCIIS